MIYYANVFILILSDSLECKYYQVKMIWKNKAFNVLDVLLIVRAVKAASEGVLFVEGERWAVLMGSLAGQCSLSLSALRE